MQGRGAGDPVAARDADSRYAWRAFTAIAISLVTMVMSMTMVFIALSSIASEFGVSLRAVSWVVIVQGVTITALMLPMGRLADIIGRRRVYLIGLALFAVGSVCCALAPSLGALLAARVVMSVGNAMGQAVSSAMVVAVFPAHDRGLALGSQTTAIAVGAAVGPVLAGLGLQVLSWRALFLLLAIPVVVAFVVGQRVLDEARVTPENDNVHARFDPVGALLSALAVVAVVITTSNPLGLAWTSPTIVGGAGLGLALLVAFAWWELRVASPMLELRLFRNRVLASAVVTRLAGFMAGAVSMLLLPIFLISYRGMGEAAAGLVSFLSAIGLGVASQACGRLADRFGERPFVVLGFGTFLVTAVSLWTLDEATPLLVVMVVVFVNGLAQGAWGVANNSMVMGAVPRSMLGVVGALSNLTRNVGTVLGQAVASAVVVAAMVARGFDVALDEVRSTPGAGSAFLEGWQHAFVIAIALTVVGLVATLATLATRPGPPSEPGPGPRAVAPALEGGAA